MSVAEVAHAGEDHGDAVLVRGRDHFRVAHAAAGLDHRGGAGFGQRRRAPSRNGKNASDATTEPSSERPASAALIAAMRALSTRLICPAPTPSVMRSPQNTMAFDFTYLATRQAKRGPSAAPRVGAALRDELEVLARRAPASRASARAARRRRACSRSACAACGQRHLQHPEFSFAAKDLLCSRLDARRDHDLGELASRRFGGLRVERAVERDDAAESRRRIGLERASRRLPRACRATATPHGLACLTMTQAGSVEALDALPCRVGVGDVVVGKLLALELAVARRCHPARVARLYRTLRSDAGSRRSADPRSF